VGQVLDSTYASRDIEISFNAIFNDINAINVINGIVKAGEFHVVSKLEKKYPPLRTTGRFGIMRRGNDKLIYAIAAIRLR